AEFIAADVIHLARNKVIHDICQRGNEVVDIHKDAMVPEINVIRYTVKSSIRKQTNDAAVFVVILARPIAIEESQAKDRIAEALSEIHDLNFVNPFGDGVIVMLNDQMVQWNIFRKDMLVLVAIDFG